MSGLNKMSDFNARRFVVAVCLSVFCGSVSAETRVGFVDRQRVIEEAPQAVKARKRIEKDFEKRDQELQRLTRQLQATQSLFDRNSMAMAEAERRDKERELTELTRELQRKQREYREDLSLRQSEEMTMIFEQINKAIKQIADAEKYDLILQEAVYFNQRIDITDKVIKTLNDGAKSNP